jgi:hypothetical protein
VLVGAGDVPGVVHEVALVLHGAVVVVTAAERARAVVTVIQKSRKLKNTPNVILFCKVYFRS